MKKPVDNATYTDTDNRKDDIQPLAWMKKANCRGATHKMFPREHKDITYIQEARIICSECKVQKECLDYALSFPMGDIHGVWAGMTPRQLTAEQARRGIKPTQPTLAQIWSDLH